jgi:hypothetical protein
MHHKIKVSTSHSTKPIISTNKNNPNFQEIKETKKKEERKYTIGS